MVKTWWSRTGKDKKGWESGQRGVEGRSGGRNVHRKRQVILSIRERERVEEKVQEKYKKCTVKASKVHIERLVDRKQNKKEKKERNTFGRWKTRPCLDHKIFLSKRQENNTKTRWSEPGSLTKQSQNDVQTLLSHETSNMTRSWKEEHV